MTRANRESPLGLDSEELVTCVECGLCLPHCPTYRVTGLEIASPRGRINAMRRIESGMTITAEFTDAMEACVQCRGCEAACPSSVPFGHLMEGTRTAIAPVSRAGQPRWRRAAETIGFRGVLPRRRVLRAASWLLWCAQRLRVVPARLGAPKLSGAALRQRVRYASRADADVWIFTGCVMDAWQRPVHAATMRVFDAISVAAACPERGGDCCGALHQHAGRSDEARTLARRVIESMPGGAPVVVNSAGCGAAMKEYGHLLGTDAAHTFSMRVRDFAEFVAASGTPELEPRDTVVVIQDPCHLRHVQRAHGAVRDILRPAYELRETADDGLCCGAGGIYSAVQPELAGAIRDRKAATLRAAVGGAAKSVVASGNPGCALHLRGAGFDVLHPAELIADALVAPKKRSQNIRRESSESRESR